MPLQNRISPFGELIAAPSRGGFFGNRGGKFHRDDRTLGKRRPYASKQWICCVLSFKGRQRDVWGRYYTELFFLDEPTALAAGHRPCFECRRAEATAFAEKFGKGRPARAGEMDLVLHRERLEKDGRSKKLHPVSLSDLPDGVFITLTGNESFAVNGKRLLRWSPGGYCEAIKRPSGSAMMLTPPATMKTLARGYAPHWHESAASL